MNKLESTQKQTDICYKICENFSWLLNCYVLDFFTEKHWDKLSETWRTSLENLNPAEISCLLDYEVIVSTHILPLSLIALKSLLKATSLSRKIVNLNIGNPCFMEEKNLLKFFWKNVKAKKQHEISIMSKICYDSACKTDCFYLVDIGSGLGHLSRMLNYGYGFKVVTIEAQELLSRHARSLDQEFETVLDKKSKADLKYHKTVHIHLKLCSNITPSHFVDVVKTAFNIEDDNCKFGIVGLHPCGDLGPILLRLYAECPQVQFINIVGCCYMKLTTDCPQFQGFPMSHFCRSNNYTLSYHSREIACHAIESYVEKLRTNEYWRLKIHTYRAALEKLIVQHHPSYQHHALNNVKYTENLSFKSYCEKATRRLGLRFSDEQTESGEIVQSLEQWKKVVLFYSLRLLLAPIVESLILLDRLNYLLESGNEAQIISVFDPKISPRAHVLTANKFIRKEV